MAQVVKVKVSDPGVNARRDKTLLHIHQTFIHAPLGNASRSEHKITFLSLALLYQYFSNALTHWDNPIACSLCIDHVNHAPKKIDVPPRQIQQLTATHSRTERQCN
jgi:hypothetical protein